jgi:hypothetical protein
MKTTRRNFFQTAGLGVAEQIKLKKVIELE